MYCNSNNNNNNNNSRVHVCQVRSETVTRIDKRTSSERKNKPSRSQLGVEWLPNPFDGTFWDSAILFCGFLGDLVTLFWDI